MGLSVEQKQRLATWGPWIFRAVILIIILVLAWFWNAEHKAKLLLKNENESLKLQQQGYVDDINKKQADLNKLGKQMLDKDKAWQTQVNDMARLLGEKPQILRVVEWKTKPAPVEVPVNEPGEKCPTDNKKIVLTEGDQLHAELNEIDWGTKSNNNIMTGRVMCFRDTPTPLLLHSQLISEKQPEGGGQGAVYVPPLETPYLWGAGVFFTMTKTSWAAGPKILFPPFDVNLILFKPRLETDAGIAIGPSGERVLQLSAATRWR